MTRAGGSPTSRSAPRASKMASEISNPPGEANVVLVPWAGGACDVRTEITFKAAGQGLAGR